MELKKLYKDVEQTISPERLEQLIKQCDIRIKNLYIQLDNAMSLGDLSCIYSQLSSEYLTIDLLTCGHDSTARANAKSYKQKSEKIEGFLNYCYEYKQADDEFDDNKWKEFVNELNADKQSASLNGSKKYCEYESDEYDKEKLVNICNNEKNTCDCENNCEFPYDCVDNEDDYEINECDTTDDDTTDLMSIVNRISKLCQDIENQLKNMK